MRSPCHGVRCRCTTCWLPEFSPCPCLFALDCEGLSRDGPWLPLCFCFLCSRVLGPPCEPEAALHPSCSLTKCWTKSCLSRMQGIHLSRWFLVYCNHVLYTSGRRVLRSYGCVWVTCSGIWGCGCDSELWDEMAKCS